MSNFYHIYIDPKPGVTKERMQEVFNLSLDWYRYDPKCWVVYTTSDAAKWYTRLEPLFGKTGYAFIVKLNPEDYHGWMPKAFWTWIADRKEGKPIEVKGQTRS